MGEVRREAADVILLDLSLDQCPDFFHPPAIDAEVAVADPGGGTEMDCLGFIVEQELHVVDESQQQARELNAQVRVVFFGEPRAGQRQDDCFQRFFRFCLAPLIPERGDRMLFVLGLG